MLNVTDCGTGRTDLWYQVQEYRKYELEYLTDPMLKNQLKEFNDSKSSLILINHQKAETILQHEEVLEYDAYKFISDSGKFFSWKSYENFCWKLMFFWAFMLMFFMFFWLNIRVFQEKFSGNTDQKSEIFQKWVKFQTCSAIIITE